MPPLRSPMVGCAKPRAYLIANFAFDGLSSGGSSADEVRMASDPSRRDPAPRKSGRRHIRHKVKVAPFVILVEAVATGEGWTPTRALLAAAGLNNDPERGRGALKMLHVIGLA